MSDLTLETLVKVTDDDRSSMHGGWGKWRRGAWRSVKPPLVACERGIHVVTIRQSVAWLGPRMGMVEVSGERIDQHDKSVVERARVIEWLDTWNERSQRLFSADCAEHVLHHFEDRYPDDDRPRKAIAAARAYAEGHIDSAARSAAYWAALSAARSAALSAARSAAYWAAYSAARSAALSAAGSAAYSAAYSAADWAERDWQARRLLDYLRGEA